MTTTHTVSALPRDRMIPWPGLNPRRLFDQDRLDELRSSIETNGLIEPIAVKPPDKDGDPYLIFAGERRWRATEGVLEEIPVIIRDITHEDAYALALTENIQRSDLTAMEEAWGIQNYIDAHVGADRPKQKAVAKQLGMSGAWVSNRLRLLDLTHDLQELVQAGTVTPSQARDYILPFAKLSDELFETLCAEVVKQLDGRSRVDSEFHRLVAKVAIKMSFPLEGSPIYPESVIKGFDAWRVRIPEERWTHAPAGTVVAFKYDYRSEKRVFDEKWWTAEMERERERMKAEAEKRAAEEPDTEEDEEEWADLEWSPELGPIPEDHRVPYEQLHVVAEVRGSWGRSDNLTRGITHGESRTCGTLNIFADPRWIEDGELVLNRVDGQMELLATTRAALDRATAKLEETRDAMVAKRVDEALEAATASAVGPDELHLVAAELAAAVQADGLRWGEGMVYTSRLLTLLERRLPDAAPFLISTEGKGSREAKLHGLLSELPGIDVATALAQLAAIWSEGAWDYEEAARISVMEQLTDSIEANLEERGLLPTTYEPTPSSDEEE